MTARHPSVPNWMLMKRLYLQVGQRRIEFVNNLPHLCHRPLQTVRAEQCRATDEHIRPGARALAGCFEIHPTVNTDGVIEPPFLSPRIHLLNLGQGFVDKLLPTEPRI